MLENLTLTGAAALNCFGNSLDNIATKGNAGANLLQGYDGNDTLSGSLANDILQGGWATIDSRMLAETTFWMAAAANTLVGSAGNEFFAGGAGSEREHWNRCGRHRL